MPDTPTIALSTPAGPVPIPQIGFGVWQVPEDEVAESSAKLIPKRDALTASGPA